LFRWHGEPPCNSPLNCRIGVGLGLRCRLLSARSAEFRLRGKRGLPSTPWSFYILSHGTAARKSKTRAISHVREKIFKLHHSNHLRPSAAAERTEKPNPACYNASRKSGGKPGDNDGPGHNKRWGARRSKCSAPIRPQLIVSRLVGYLRSKIDSPIRIRRLMGCFEPPSRGLV